MIEELTITIRTSKGNRDVTAEEFAEFFAKKNYVVKIEESKTQRCIKLSKKSPNRKKYTQRSMCKGGRPARMDEHIQKEICREILNGETISDVSTRYRVSRSTVAHYFDKWHDTINYNFEKQEHECSLDNTPTDLLESLNNWD